MKLGMLGLFLALGAGSASALDIKTGNSPEGQAADLATGALTTQLGMEAEKLAEQSAPAQPSTGPVLAPLAPAPRSCRHRRKRWITILLKNPTKRRLLTAFCISVERFHEQQRGAGGPLFVYVAITMLGRCRGPRPC